ncbi:MAG: glycosyltransferase [Desulfobacteraceae bacterium]|nr:MAG: glycosyltransferase [Desulfobacteraceae bacterium]
MSFAKANLFGISFSLVDYEKASTAIIERASRRESFGVSALAVHGLIESVRKQDVMAAVQKIQLVVPDGQPVRWTLNSFYRADLKDRVYGPTLTLEVLAKANRESLGVYLFGSKDDTIKRFAAFIREKYPCVRIAGIQPDRFREATLQEDTEDIGRINLSGAHIVLVGRGCPRQEKWVSDHIGKIHAAMMAVGAAFDFHAGTVQQAPAWMGRMGLEWLFRLSREPGRLWKRYLFTNSYFILLFLTHKYVLRRPY